MWLAALAVVALVAGCDRQPETAKSASTRPDSVTITPGPDGVQLIEVEAGDDYRFHPAMITATVGSIELTFRHVGTGAPHDWVAAGIPHAAIPLVRAGQTASVRFEASHPGSYRFVCTIHEAQGQVGQLVIRPK